MISLIIVDNNFSDYAVRRVYVNCSISLNLKRCIANVAIFEHKVESIGTDFNYSD